MIILLVMIPPPSGGPGCGDPVSGGNGLASNNLPDNNSITGTAFYQKGWVIVSLMRLPLIYCSEIIMGPEFDGKDISE